METVFSVAVHGEQVRAILHKPSEKPCACLVLCHGLTGDAHERMLISIARSLEKHGIACVRFDCRGSGDSDGTSREACVTSEAEDMIAVYDAVSCMQEIDRKRIFFGGHSLGALVALMAAERRSVRGLVLMGAALSCYHELIAMLTGEVLTSFCRTGVIDLDGFEVSKKMVDELSDIDGYSIAERLQIPTLLLHGQLDGDSPVYHSVRLKEKLGNKAQLEIIPGVHHCFETAAGHAAVAEKVTMFLQTLNDKTI